MSRIQAHLFPPELLPALTTDQEKKLEANFASNRNPSDLDVILIAAEVGLTEYHVKVRCSQAVEWLTNL